MLFVHDLSQSVWTFLIGFKVMVVNAVFKYKKDNGIFGINIIIYITKLKQRQQGMRRK